MMIFSDRLNLAKQYEEFLKDNPEVKDCALSVITWLAGLGLLSNWARQLKVKRCYLCNAREATRKIMDLDACDTCWDDWEKATELILPGERSDG